MAPGYTALPPIYDRWQNLYGRDYTTIIFPRLQRSLARCRVPVGTMLDVASGTGTLAMKMARIGWKVYGIDVSPLMVAEAMRKTGRHAVRVLFLQQDMRQIRLPERVDLATSMFDSLNHVTNRRDLLRTFRGVARALRPGGYFMFDLNNERCYRRLWTQAGTMEHEDFTLVLQSRYEPTRRRATCFVTIFSRDGDHYSRSGEVVEERLYPREEVRQLLAQAGFRIVECQDFNFTEAPEVGDIKTWYVARKAE